MSNPDYTDADGTHYTWLQATGYVHTLAVDDLAAGDVLAYNYGGSSVVVDVRRASPKFLAITTVGEKGIVWQSRRKLGTRLPYWRRDEVVPTLSGPIPEDAPRRSRELDLRVVESPEVSPEVSAEAVEQARRVTLDLKSTGPELQRAYAILERTDDPACEPHLPDGKLNVQDPSFTPSELLPSQIDDLRSANRPLDVLVNPAAMGCRERQKWARRVVAGETKIPAGHELHEAAVEILRRAENPDGICQATGEPRRRGAEPSIYEIAAEQGAADDRLAGIADHLGHQDRTDVPGGFVSTVGCGGGRWEVAFISAPASRDDGDFDDAVRRFDDKAKADTYHAQLVAEQGRLAEVDAARQRIARGERRFPIRESVPVVPTAFALLLAWTAFAAGQQATVHRQDPDAARKARQEVKILRNAPDDEDPGDGFEGRVSAPTGVSASAQPFQEVG